MHHGRGSVVVLRRISSRVDIPTSEALSSHLRLPTRSRPLRQSLGVALDHPEVKICLQASSTWHRIPLRRSRQNRKHKFYQTEKNPRQRFFGSVEVGPQTLLTIPHTLPTSLSSEKSHNTYLLFSTGCAITTLYPVLRSSNRISVVPKLSPVYWYTQRPSCPSPSSLHETELVSIIGQGKTSLDVARMLLTLPVAIVKCNIPPAPVTVLDVLRGRAPRLHYRPPPPPPCPHHHQRAARTHHPRQHVHTPPLTRDSRPTHALREVHWPVIPPPAARTAATTSRHLPRAVS